MWRIYENVCYLSVNLECIITSFTAAVNCDYCYNLHVAESIGNTWVPIHLCSTLLSSFIDWRTVLIRAMVLTSDWRSCSICVQEACRACPALTTPARQLSTTSDLIIFNTNSWLYNRDVLSVVNINLKTLLHKIFKMYVRYYTSL